MAALFDHLQPIHLLKPMTLFECRRRKPGANFVLYFLYFSVLLRLLRKQRFMHISNSISKNSN